MSVKGFKSHPYIPNSVPEVEQEMLREIGLTSLEQLHEEVPDEIILKENMNLPEAFGSEYELRRHVEKLLKKNSSCDDNLNFLGAGCPPSATRSTARASSSPLTAARATTTSAVSSPSSSMRA